MSQNTAAQTTLDIVAAEFALAEQRYAAKYPHLTIVKGSMVQDLDHPLYKNKVRVKVICPVSGTEVERATSDLHTFKACSACMPGIRKANKAGKAGKADSELAIAKAQLAQLLAEKKALEEKALAAAL